MPPIMNALERWPRAAPAVALALALLPVIGYLSASYGLVGELGFPLDDSWIHLQFARNLAQGEGLSFNPGVLVTGSTSPLWTALLSVLFLLPGSVVVWTLLLGTALHLAGVAATYVLARELGSSRGWAGIAATLTAGTYWLVWSALSGMEIPLFVLLSLWGMILHARERRDPSRPPISLALLGASALARPEGVLLVLAAVVDSLIVARRSGDEVRLSSPRWGRIAIGLGLALLALIPTYAFYASVGGSPLPTTFGAKASSSMGWWPNQRYLYLVFGILFKPQPYTSFLAAAGILRLLTRIGTDKDRGLLPGMWLVGLPLAYSFLSPMGRHLLVGNFGRYYFPLFPVIAVLGVLGLEQATRFVTARFRAGGVTLPVRAIAVALVLLPTFTNLVNNANFYAHNVANVHDSDVALGRWAKLNLPPEAVLAVQDIGAIKYFAPQRIIDLVGLVSPDIQSAIRDSVSADDPMGETGVAKYLSQHRPDFLIAYPAWHPTITGDTRFFEPIYRHEIPDNITMAGDELVVYVTPWCRFRQAEEPPEATPEPVAGTPTDAAPPVPPPSPPER